MITKRVHDNESYMGPSDPFKRSQSCIVQNNPVEAISNTIRSPKAYFLPMKCDMSVFFRESCFSGSHEALIFILSFLIFFGLLSLLLHNRERQSVGSLHISLQSNAVFKSFSYLMKEEAENW